MSDSIRAFIAVPLNPTLRQVIVKAQTALKPLDMDVKWVEPDNIHLTLKFLGDIVPKDVTQIKTAMSDLYKNVKAVKTRVQVLGAFPDSRHPRVIWMSLDDTHSQIAGLALLLKNGLAKIGHPKDSRTFKAHITLGRVRSPKNTSTFTRVIHDYRLDKDREELLNRIILFKSTLTPHGPIYEPLHTVNLPE